MGVPSTDEESVAPVYWDDDVALTLTDLAQESETRASGRVQVITLAAFRSSIGDLWGKYEARILLITETTISRMIGRGNTFIPQDKDTWLLLFPRLPETEALARTDAIAAKIGEKLVGAQFTETPPPLPEASKLDLDGALNADGSLNVERLKTAVESVRRTAGGLPPLAVAPKRPARAVRPVTPRPAAIIPAGSKAANLTTVFRPAWNAETQCIDSFFLRALNAEGTDIFSLRSPPPDDVTALKHLENSARAFSELCERGLRAVLTVPVPFTTLQGPLGHEVQRLITNLRQRERLMYLRLEVTHIPERVGAETLVAVRELFRPYTRGVAFFLDLFALSEQALALDHVTLGAEIPRATPHSDDDAFQAMLVFRQRAGRRPTYLLGLHSRAQVAHAVTAGITEVSGSGVVAETTKLPDQVVVINKQDLLI